MKLVMFIVVILTFFITAEPITYEVPPELGFMHYPPVMVPAKNFATHLTEFPELTRPPGFPRVAKHNTVHHILTTDGPPVCSRPRRLAPQKLKTLMQMCGSKRVRTTSYHPCANGLVERMHRQLKAALMCHEETWHKSLPVVLLGMRAALKQDLQCSPAQLVYGEPLRLPDGTTEANTCLPPWSAASLRFEGPLDCEGYVWSLLCP
ncbi:unnamed protein product, partial [Iphiclides podalirius]